MFFSFPLSTLMVLEEDRQRQLGRLAGSWSNRNLGPAGPPRQRSRRPLGPSATWANFFGRREHRALPAASLVAK
jgi:hypothetical protein